jgi:hypothetical protein
MLANLVHHSFVEAGYLGHAIRSTAVRRADGCFTALLEIRDYRDAGGALVHRQWLSVTYANADVALDEAQACGRVAVENLLEMQHILETVDV